MPDVQKEGNYVAVLSNCCITRSKSGLPVFEASCELTQWWDGRTKQNVPVEPKQHIRAFLMMFRLDKTPIENTIKNLKEALGWDGKSLKALVGLGDGKEVSVTIQRNEGQNAADYPFVVAFINPRFKSRALPAEDMDTLAAEFDAKLGGAAVPVPAGAKEDLPY